MKQLLIAVSLLCVFTTSSFAAKSVYLMDGSVINAQKVWRSNGMVHVLVNRDTLADFNNSEVNIKKTFIKHKTVSRKHLLKHKTGVATETEMKNGTNKREKNRTGVSVSTAPSLPDAKTADQTGKEEGSIRKHNREIAEKAAE